MLSGRIKEMYDRLILALRCLGCKPRCRISASRKKQQFLECFLLCQKIVLGIHCGQHPSTLLEGQICLLSLQRKILFKHCSARQRNVKHAEQKNRRWAFKVGCFLKGSGAIQDTDSCLTQVLARVAWVPQIYIGRDWLSCPAYWLFVLGRDVRTLELLVSLTCVALDPETYQ